MLANALAVFLVARHADSDELRKLLRLNQRFSPEERSTESSTRESRRLFFSVPEQYAAAAAADAE